MQYHRLTRTILLWIVTPVLSMVNDHYYFHIIMSTHLACASIPVSLFSFLLLRFSPRANSTLISSKFDWGVMRKAMWKDPSTLWKDPCGSMWKDPAMLGNCCVLSSDKAALVRADWALMVLCPWCNNVATCMWQVPVKRNFPLDTWTAALVKFRRWHWNWL